MEGTLEGMNHHVTVSGTMIRTCGLQQAGIETVRVLDRRRAGIDVVNQVRHDVEIVQYMGIMMGTHQVVTMAEEPMDVRVGVKEPGMIIANGAQSKTVSVEAQVLNVRILLCPLLVPNGWSMTDLLLTVQLRVSFAIARRSRISIAHIKNSSQ